MYWFLSSSQLSIIAEARRPGHEVELAANCSWPLPCSVALCHSISKPMFPEMRLCSREQPVATAIQVKSFFSACCLRYAMIRAFPPYGGKRSWTFSLRLSCPHSQGTNLKILVLMAQSMISFWWSKEPPDLVLKIMSGWTERNRFSSDFGSASILWTVTFMVVSKVDCE